MKMVQRRVVGSLVRMHDTFLMMMKLTKQIEANRSVANVPRSLCCVDEKGRGLLRALLHKRVTFVSFFLYIFL